MRLVTILVLLFSVFAEFGLICKGALQQNIRSPSAERVYPKSSVQLSGNVSSDIRLQIPVAITQSRINNDGHFLKDRNKASESANHKVGINYRDDIRQSASLDTNQHSAENHARILPTPDHSKNRNISDKIQTSNTMPHNQLPNAYHHVTHDFPLIEEDLFWSQKVEHLLPPVEHVHSDWIHSLQSRKILHMERGTLDKCGRDGNAYAILDDGSQICIRNSKVGNFGLVGELLAFQLSRVLRMQTVPSVALSKISTNENSIWAGQMSQLDALDLDVGKYVTFIRWIPGLSEACLPVLVQQEPYTVNHGNPLLNELNTTSLVTLVEWTELLVFDYISGHIDRMTITYDGVLRSGLKWLLKIPVHNLARNKLTGELCIFDNECAFFTSYQVIRSSGAGRNYSTIYDNLLDSVCVFRRETVAAIARLREINKNDIIPFLIDLVKKDPIGEQFLKDEIGSNAFVFLRDIIKQRIEKVYTHMQQCRERIRQ